MVAAALIGCGTRVPSPPASPPGESPKIDVSVAANQALSERRGPDGALNATLFRRLAVVYLPGNESPLADEELPSKWFHLLVNQIASPESHLFNQFLERVDSSKWHGPDDNEIVYEYWAGRTMPILLGSCNAESLPPKSALTPVLESSNTPSHVKALDAKFRFVVVRCGAANSNFNFTALRSRLDEVADFYEVSTKSTNDLMLAQAELFIMSPDKEIPVPEYLRQRAEISLRRIWDLIELSIPRNATNASVKLPYPALTFDREKMGLPPFETDSARGMFNAFGRARPQQTQYERTVYISPTFIRAAFIRCVASTHYDASLTPRLKIMLKNYLAGRRSDSDLSDASLAAKGDTAKMNQCISESIDFTLGHELGHFIGGIESEESADCVGHFISQEMHGNEPGLFQRLIFDLAKSQEYKLLAIDDLGRKQLACRSELLSRFPADDNRKVEAKLPRCAEVAPECTNPRFFKK
ncbi:hypothetical protein HNP55_001037 [Paucibacter oligotrophus]|uniref:Uncharacterized protein n=1 Tax=Roseateles oligotrophus TaxID=1769250 RepID=A0A840L755_9BURK|nr:hypothetical protein [Roseateles oligotrophus]MBB4842522.1 hypothetical protein [Roseateles oligotrophus]